MPELLRLTLIFFRIGLFTVGGGYAMLPMLQREVVEKYRWLTEEELLNIFAIGQSTPGIIAINVATFVGTKRHGLAGAIFATLGMVLPSLIIIILIAGVFQEFRDNTVVKSAFSGIRAAVAGLLIIIVARLAGKSINDNYGYKLMICAFAAVVIFKVPAIWVIIAGGAAGVIYYSIQSYSNNTTVIQPEASSSAPNPPLQQTILTDNITEKNDLIEKTKSEEEKS